MRLLPGQSLRDLALSQQKSILPLFIFIFLHHVRFVLFIRSTRLKYRFSRCSRVAYRNIIQICFHHRWDIDLGCVGCGSCSDNRLSRRCWSCCCGLRSLGGWSRGRALVRIFHRLCTAGLACLVGLLTAGSLRRCYHIVIVLRLRSHDRCLDRCLGFGFFTTQWWLSSLVGFLFLEIALNTPKIICST